MSRELSIIIRGQEFKLTELTRNPIVQLKYKEKVYDVNITTLDGLIMTKEKKDLHKLKNTVFSQV